MIDFLIQASFCWAIFLIIYILFLRDLTFFGFNRIYLLSSVLLGLIFPFLAKRLKWMEAATSKIEIILPEIIVAPYQQFSGNTSDFFNTSWFFAIYIIMVSLLSIRFFYGIYRIYRIYKQANKIVSPGHILVKSREINHPFSFFNLIFLPFSKFEMNQQEMIIAHEKNHVIEGHSYDVLLLTILKIVLWFHPLVYLFNNLVKANHEYAVDSKMSSFKPSEYIKLLLFPSFIDSKPQFVNTLFNTNLKNRIQMMNKNRSRRSSAWRYAILIPSCIFLLFILIQCNDNVPLGADSEKELAKNVNEVAYGVEQEELSVFASSNDYQDQKVFKEVDQMPALPGCENESAENRDMCEKKKLLEYVYTNIKYPQAARKAGQEGQVVSRFVVGNDGKVRDIEIIKSASLSLDEAALKMFEKMQTELTFNPGIKDGKEVSVYYTLPIKFKLQ